MMRFALALGVSPVLLLALFVALGMPFLAFASNKDQGEAKGEVLLIPVLGACVALVVLAALTQAGLTGERYTPIILFVAVCSAVWTLRQVGPAAVATVMRPLVYPGLMFFLCYMVFVSPVILNGHLGVTGYNVNNDPVVHVVLVDHIVSDGYRIPEVTSSFTDVVNDKLSEGYPTGFHMVAGVVSVVTGLPAFYLFNAVLAVFAALSVFVFYFLARHLGLNRALVPVTALALTIGYLTVGFTLQGFASQIAMTPFLYAGMVGIYGFFCRPDYRAAGVLAVMAVLSTLIVYSFTAALWLVPFTAAALVLCSLRFGAREGARRAAMLAAAIAAGALLTTLPALMRFLGPLRGEVSSREVMGNMLGKISPSTISGAWLSTDHRLPPSRQLFLAISYLCGAVGLVFLFLGLDRAVRSRRYFVLLAGLTAMGAVAFLWFTSGPYYYSKAVQLSAGAVGLAAFYGLDGIISLVRGRLAGWLRLAAGWAVAAGVFLFLAVAAMSDVLEVVATAYTPAARFTALEDIERRLAHRGPGLFIEREDWAKYFLRDSESNSLADGAFRARAILVQRRPLDAPTIDLDSLLYDRTQGFEFVVAGRANRSSFPSPMYSAAGGNGWYVIYRRDLRMQNLLGEHVSAEGVVRPGLQGGVILQPGESRAFKFSRSVPATASLAVAAYSVPDVAVRAGSFNMGTGWTLWSVDKRMAANIGLPARSSITAAVTAPEAGEYAVRVMGRLSNKVTVMVGDKRFTAGPSTDGGPAYFDAGRVRLEADATTTVSVGTTRRTPRDVTLFEKVVFTKTHRSGTASVTVTGHEGSRRIRLSMQPGVRQLDASGVMGKRGGSTLALRNEGPLPVKIDWLEWTRRPYPRQVLVRNESRFARDPYYLTAGP